MYQERNWKNAPKIIALQHLIFSFKKYIYSLYHSAYTIFFLWVREFMIDCDILYNLLSTIRTATQYWI